MYAHTIATIKAVILRASAKTDINKEFNFEVYNAPSFDALCELLQVPSLKVFDFSVGRPTFEQVDIIKLLK